MADWLQLNDWLYDGLDSMLTTSLHGTLLADYAGFMALVLAATLACVSVLVVFMLGLGLILWIEPKLWARMMDRRGRTTDWRSLWVGEQGVTAGEWWNKVPYGLGRPIGAINRWLNKVMGNASEHPSVERVNNRSWHGAWWALPGFVQTIADGAKFLTKEHMPPTKADRFIYEISPFLIISSTVLIIGFMPFSSGIYAINPELSVLFALAIFGIAPLGVFFAGWSSNNKYTLIGGIRSAAQLTAYEIPLLITVLGVCVLSGSFNFIEIVNFQHSAGAWNFFLMPLGFGLFIITMIAEVERIPFDMPEAEAELVEGWWTEYGGMRWGLLFAAEYMRVWAACILCTVFFLGGWSAPFAGLMGNLGVVGVVWNDLIPGVVWTMLKSLFIFLIFVWARASLPRVRTDQILEFGWRYLLPLSVVQLAIAVTLRLWFYDPAGLGSGSAWDGGSGFFWLVPLVVFAVSMAIFVVYSIDEDKDPPSRPYHVHTVEPAGTHVAGSAGGRQRIGKTGMR